MDLLTERIIKVFVLSTILRWRIVMAKSRDTKKEEKKKSTKTAKEKKQEKREKKTK